MPCCLGIISLIFPRLALFVMWLIGYTATVFETRLWPLFGFFFMPYTTCAFAIAMNEVGEIAGVGFALVVMGVILDAGSHGGSVYTSWR